MTRSLKLTLTFFALFVICLASSGFAQTSTGSGDAAYAKIREKVKQYSDVNKTVKVTNSIGETAKGRIVRSDDNDFTLKDQRTGTERVFEYGKVAKVQKSGGLSTTAIITIAAVGTAAAILVGFLAKRCSNEGGCF
ncbi:MAG: hypothetical protein PSX80_10320 [bacterium]|nr:hypothetical protein [bacterium]